jgi:hypothetical protein
MHLHPDALHDPVNVLPVDKSWCTCRHVLNNRSDLCRARHDSGMRDAEDNELHVPEHFAKVNLLMQTSVRPSGTLLL